MSPRPLALTVGDPSGIGPEIAIEAWRRRVQEDVPAFYLLADPTLVKARADALGRQVELAIVKPGEAVGAFDAALPIVALENAFVDTPGDPHPANAAGTVEAIERAVEDVRAGLADALVTCPIAKKPLYDAGFRYPGHTEFLGHLAERHAGCPMRPVMMLAGPDLRAVPVTIHIPLAEVPRQLTSELIVETAAITAADLRGKFGIAHPRLAVAGLNPHAGEGGAMGMEDEEIVRPAVMELVRRGIDARGPLPADTMFHAGARATYDAAICMYHDQGLIPAKALAFDETVNVTLGLPFIRTSPDHGTAFDIAGTGAADPSSTIAALRMAWDMACKRAGA